MLCLRQKYSVTVYNKMSYREKTPIGYGVNAPVVKLADTNDLRSFIRMGVGVQVPPGVQIILYILLW